MSKFSGTVKANNRMGTRLGYPTANILFSDENLSGIYTGMTKLLYSDDPKVTEAFKANNLPSVIFIGRPEIFGDKTLRLESHILDFPMMDLYGSVIEVEIFEKLRDSKKFKSEEKLIIQMRQDEQKAREWFRKRQTPS